MNDIKNENINNIDGKVDCVMSEKTNNPIYIDNKLVSSYDEVKNNEQINLEMAKMLYIELPNLIHRILHSRISPMLYDEEFLKADIDQIKKITNAECDAAISYFQKLQ